MITTVLTVPDDLDGRRCPCFGCRATPTDRRAIVAAAARRLDRVAPHWYRRVDRTELDLSSLNRCVLGQVFGDYGTGLALLYVGTHFDPPRSALAFTPFATRADWLAEVDRRLAVAGPNTGREDDEYEDDDDDADADAVTAGLVGASA